MISKIIASVVLSILGIAALADFLLIYQGHLDQFGFLSLSFGVLFSMCGSFRLASLGWDS
jgi:phosphatidylserine synthase